MKMKETVSILIAPDGSEIVIPVPDKSMSRIKVFVGTNTAKVYDKAKVRHDQEGLNVGIRLLKMSNWPEIVKWFAVYPDQLQRLTVTSSEWMLHVAEAMKDNGIINEEEITVDKVNEIVEIGEA